MATTSKSTEFIFRGYIMSGRDGDASSVLYLVDHTNPEPMVPLVEQVSDKLGWGSKQVSVRYHITDGPMEEDALTESIIASLCGVSASGGLITDYGHRYSEITGYLWTAEDLKVGGHDLIRELRSYKGKWCHLIIIKH